MNLGKRIEARLRERGWSQAKLISAVNAKLPDGAKELSASRLSAAIKRDSEHVQLEREIADALQVSRDWLIYGDDPKAAASCDDAAGADQDPVVRWLREAWNAIPESRRHDVATYLHGASGVSPPQFDSKESAA